LLVILRVAIQAVPAGAFGQESPTAIGAGANVTETERARRLKERDQHRNAALRLANAGRLDDAAQEAEAALVVERNKLGELSHDVVESLSFLARLHEARGDWTAAANHLQELVSVRERQDLRQDWHVRDARQMLADLNRRAAMTPDQRQRLLWVRDQNQYAVSLSAKEQHQAAAAVMRGVLPAVRELMGEGHRDYATSLNNLAVQYQFMGDYRRAAPLFCQALEIRKNAVGENHPDYAGSLSSVGECYREMGEYHRAEPFSRRALEVRRQCLGEDHLDYAKSLNNLGLLYETLGDHGRAESLLSQALAVTKKAVGESDPRYATRLNNLGNLYQSMGDQLRAERLMLQAMEIWKNAAGENHLDFALSLNDLAELYRAMGDYAAALPLCRQALVVLKNSVGEHHPHYATALNNLGLLLWDMGDYTGAEPPLRQGTELLRELLRDDHPKYAMGMGNLGRFYQQMGDYPRAEKLLRQTSEILRTALGEHHPDYATSLCDLAVLYHGTRDFARAEPLVRRAAEVDRFAFGENHPRYAGKLEVLGVMHSHLGDYPLAEAALRRAMEITKKKAGEDCPRYGTLLNNLAMIYDARGDSAQAEALFRRALTILEKTVGQDHPFYAPILTNLALRRHSSGDSVEAASILERSLDFQTKFFDATGAGLGERSRLALLNKLRTSLDVYLSVGLEIKARPEVLYRRVLAWKGISATYQAEGILAREQTELKLVLEELASARGGLAQLAFTSPTPAQRQIWETQLDIIREHKERAEAAVGHHSGSCRAARQSARVGPDGVIAALPSGTVLVDLIVYSHFSSPPSGQHEFRQEPRLLAFALRRNRPIVCAALGPEKPVTDAVLNWHRAFRAGIPKARDQSAAVVARLVWEPLRTQLADARTVFVAPDGLLSSFPFAALPGRKLGAYLVEDVAIAYVGSGREAAALLTSPAQTDPGGFLAAGAIDFQADTGRVVPAPLGQRSLFVVPNERGGFAALPGTKAEGELARDVFRRAFPDQPAVLLTGAQPTESVIKKRLDGGHWRAVHLGTHGFFESPARVAALRSALRPDLPFALESKPTTADDGAAVLELAPFLMSGVLLAGGARDRDPSQSDPSSDAPPIEDGILTGEEVRSLDLRGTELVVLSACETGLGRVRYGQGVLGLQRAFHAAGARSVVASLWKVDDAATSVLMEQFYTNLWVKKVPKLEALRQAQITVLRNPGLVRARQTELAKRGIGEKAEKLPEGGKVSAPRADGARSDPSLSAAFVMSGDWR
jgi:CHAT domain-containing protein/tetratricopeptide (TPR) repeat protein